MTPGERAEKIWEYGRSTFYPSDVKRFIAAEISAALEEFIQRNAPDEYVRLRKARAEAYEGAVKIAKAHKKECHGLTCEDCAEVIAQAIEARAAEAGK